MTEAIFANLREKGVYYRKQRYSHRYPHCWRCGSELVYRLVDEWFIDGPLYDKPREEVTAEEKARQLALPDHGHRREINWYPGFGYDREMDWLRNMHDWMISKKRYYGAGAAHLGMRRMRPFPRGWQRGRAGRAGRRGLGGQFEATRRIGPLWTR
jgi:isoleucyl-tRNA synthetase